VGDATLVEVPPEYTEPGRASLEGERPAGGRGDDDRGGAPEPVYFFCVRVREKIAWDLDDWAFMSVSFVLLIEVPRRISLQKEVLVLAAGNDKANKATHSMTSLAFFTFTSLRPPQII
jgi:hypothetical protein